MLRVRAAGVCGSDLHIYHDTFVNRPPVVLGHEFSGEVVELGPGVENLSVGETVVVEPHNGSCGWCRVCREGMAHLCPSKSSYGYLSDGGFAEYAAVSASLCHRIPEGLSLEEAAVAEPAAVALTAVTGCVAPGDLVFVVGAGPVGLLSLQAVKAQGAARAGIVGLERDEAVRFPIARCLGADLTVNAEKRAANEAFEELARGPMSPREGRQGSLWRGGADLVIEASGSPAGAAYALRLARTAGTVVAVGLTGGKCVDIDWDDAVMKAVKLRFSYSSCYKSWEAALRLIAVGRMKVKPLITHVFPLECWKEAFKVVEEGHAVKALLLPGATP